MGDDGFEWLSEIDDHSVWFGAGKKHPTE